MLIPYNTDAPIYHFPYATIGLIVANVVIYLATASIAANDTSSFNVDLAFAELVQEFEEVEGRKPAPHEVQELKEMLQSFQQETSGSIFQLGDSDRVRWLTLEFDTINPLQWFTHNFMHADVLHLLGNMIFLWGFGIVVEGKLGWLRYLAVYSVACLLQGAIVQILMYFASAGLGLALGASGAIYSMMAIAVMWAPKNEMSCIIFFRIVPRIIELPIIVFGSIYLAMQLLFFVLHGFSMSSEALHLVGILTGVPLGILFLRKGWVDCEGWDFHTVYLAKGDKQDDVRNEFRDRNRLAAAKEAKDELEEHRTRIISSITSALNQQQGKAAVSVYEKFTADLQNGKKLPTKAIPGLVGELTKQKKYEAAIPLLVELLQRYPAEKSVGARLKLAQILITVTDQPKQGVVVLKKLPSDLPEKHARLRSKLAKLAKAALKEGSMEIEIKDW